jgi:hypothetical protein
MRHTFLHLDNMRKNSIIGIGHEILQTIDSVRGAAERSTDRRDRLLERDART